MRRFSARIVKALTRSPFLSAGYFQTISEATTKSIAEPPMPTRLMGSCDLICSIKGIFDIVADRIAVSPNGEALSPRDPPAKTAPTTKGMFNPVPTAKGIAMGISSAHVPQAVPMFPKPCP